MTNAFRITNTTSGADLGIYCGETSDDAIAAMLADARCSDAPGSDIVASIVSDETNYAGLTIAHIVERDGFGGEETQADVDAYCQAVADAISLVYPGADVSCEAGLSRRTEIGGDISDKLDDVEIDGIRTACREAAAAVWEDGEFWTEADA